MAKVKNLTISALKKEDSKRFNKQKSIIANGYNVNLDMVFRPTKLQALLRELADKMAYVSANDEINYDLVDWTSYALFLMVKYFSSVDIPDVFEEQITVMEYLIDNDFLQPIMEGFEESEIKKFNDMLATIYDNQENLEFLVNRAITHDAAFAAEDGEDDGDSAEHEGTGESAEAEN